MLSYMRRNAGSWMIKVLLVGVALSFIIGFGVLPQLSDKSGEGFVVAKVGERVITRGEWNRAVENMRQIYRNIYQDKFSEEMVKQLRLRETALDNLINQALQLQEAERLKLNVTDEELETRIRSLPYFQQDGTFSRNLYLQLLKRNFMTPADFEKKQREEMRIEKLQVLVRGTIKVSDQELWDRYRLEKEEVDLTALKVDPRTLEDAVEVSEEELMAYFQEHEEAFLAPEKVKAAYVEIRPEGFRDQVNVYTGDIEEYYDSHFEEFTHPEELRLRHILLRLKPDEDASVVAEKREILNGLKERIQKGEDFTQVAKLYSEDVSAEKGGDLGYMKKGELVPEVEKVAFALKPGEMSELVRSSYGLHILKVEDYRTSNVDPMEEVKETIREKLLLEKAWRLARRKAEEVIWEAKEGGTFGRTGSEGGGAIEAQETEYFARGEVMPGLGRESAFQQAAFSLEEKAVSQAVKGKNGYFVIRLLERKAPEVPPFEEVRDRVEKRVRRDKSKILAREKADRSLERIAGGASLEELGDEEDLEVLATGRFSRLNTYVPKIGASQDLIQDAFSMTEANPLPARTYEINGKYYVVALKDRARPERTDFLSEKESFRDQQEQRKLQEVFRQWLRELRERENVEVTPVS